MLKLKPYSSSFLTLGGTLLIGMGVYFFLLRPPLLPEDLLYMNITLPVINDNAPNLSVWLQKVFWVLGGYIFTTGLLTIFISITSFRNRLPGAISIIALSGLSSIGLMTTVNFMLDSDFKWILLIFTIPWIIAIVLYRIHK